MSNKESVPVTITTVDIKDPVPVYGDPEGLTTHVYDGPALLSDGKSLVEPMYIIETDGSPWRNKSGQLIQPIGVTNLPGPPPDDSPDPPQPQRTHLELEFYDSAAEHLWGIENTTGNIIVSVACQHSGNPEITVTYAGVELDIDYHNYTNGVAVLMASGKDIPIGTYDFLISATGGELRTGGVRISEMSRLDGIGRHTDVAGTGTSTTAISAPDLLPTAHPRWLYAHSGRDGDYYGRLSPGVTELRRGRIAHGEHLVEGQPSDFAWVSVDPDGSSNQWAHEPGEMNLNCPVDIPVAPAVSFTLVEPVDNLGAIFHLSISEGSMFGFSAHSEGSQGFKQSTISGPFDGEVMLPADQIGATEVRMFGKGQITVLFIEFMRNCEYFHYAFGRGGGSSSAGRGNGPYVLASVEVDGDEV